MKRAIASVTEMPATIKERISCFSAQKKNARRPRRTGRAHITLQDAEMFLWSRAQKLDG